MNQPDLKAPCPGGDQGKERSMNVLAKYSIAYPDRFANSRLPIEPLLKAKEAAEIIGCSKTLIYHWMDSGDLPCIVFGPGCKRIRPADLAEFINARAGGNDGRE